MMLNSLARAFGPMSFHLLARLLAGLLAVPEVFGIVYELREDDGACGGQRPTRPPQVQRAGMPMPDRLLPRRRRVDRVERQRDLDEFFGRADQRESRFQVFEVKHGVATDPA
jgi:hypothetical protein